jgi:immune inhibitor A
MTNASSARRRRSLRPVCDCPGTPGLPRLHRYEDGPSVCVAHPSVLADIRKGMRSAHVLSSADARLARTMGLLDFPTVGRTGWNDGVIYPPEDMGEPTDRPLLRSRSRAAPSQRVALPKAEGVLNCLVLLVDFADNPGTTAPAHFERLLFDPQNTDSMHRFYQEMSYGKLKVTGRVSPWLRMPKPYSWYVDNQSGTGSAFPRNTAGLLQDALTQWTQANSLKPFDANGDGFVDGLFLVHAGQGAEAQPQAARRKAMIWSHKWTLPRPFENNGVKAYAYFTAPEDGRLGVFSHEFGHFIGLPDLYDTSYRSQGVGDWCLMAGGSWLGDGDKPARLSAWCLERLGWISPQRVAAGAAAVPGSGGRSKASTRLSLAPLETDKTACVRLSKGGAAGSEYFLLENRQQTGRDAQLPGHGLALWHIDERQADNTNPIAYRVGLVQADGRRDLELNANAGDAGDLFPGSRQVTGVSDKNGLAPTTRAHDGTATGITLSRIREADGVVAVTVKQ